MSSAKYEKGSWVIDGPLPKGIVFRKNPETDAYEFFGPHGERQPDCFGLWWEAAGAKEDSEECGVCDVQELCLEKMAKTRLLKAVKALGERNSLGNLATELQVGEHAILALVAHTRGEKKWQHRKPKPSEQDLSPSGSVKTAKATESPARESCVDLAKVLGGNLLPNEHSKRTWRKRYNREKARSKWINRLYPGITLVTTYKKKQYQCKVLETFYEYNGKVYPTLYKITESIVGVRPRPDKRYKRGYRLLSNYSATKFWRLREAWEKLEEEKIRELSPLLDSLGSPAISINTEILAPYTTQVDTSDG